MGASVSEVQSRICRRTSALIGVALAGVGIYGALSYSVAARTRDLDLPARRAMAIDPMPSLREQYAAVVRFWDSTSRN